MNILFISSLYPVNKNASGTTPALHNLVKYWRHDANIVVIRPVYIYFRELFTGKRKWFIRPGKIILNNVSVIAYPVFKIPKISYFYYPLFRYLDKYLKKKKFTPDIIVSHYDKSLQIGYRFSRKNRLPLVAGLHITPDLLEENPENFSKRCSDILQYSSLIACRSNYIYKKIENWFSEFKEKSFIAYSGIEEDLIDTQVSIIERMESWKSSKKVSFISVSTLIERKKIHTNLETLAKLKDKIDWTYTIIGDGEERLKLEQLSASLGIKDQVIFRGKISRDKVIQELRKSNIFMMVSRLETFGLVYLEAMATGNIVIGSRGEGIDGIIIDGDNGFLVPAGETETLEKLLEKIVITLNKKELTNILNNSHRTISFYTATQASNNYLNRLIEIGKI